MFYEEVRIKQGLSYIPFYPLRTLYNSKFILMATSLGTNAVVVMRVHLDNWNMDGLFPLEDSNSFLSPYKILLIAPENKYLGKFYHVLVCCIDSLASPY